MLRKKNCIRAKLTNDHKKYISKYVSSIHFEKKINSICNPMCN